MMNLSSGVMSYMFISICQKLLRKIKQKLTWFWSHSNTLSNIISDTSAHCKSRNLDILQPYPCRSYFYSTHLMIDEWLNSSTLFYDSSMLIDAVWLVVSTQLFCVSVFVHDDCSWVTRVRWYYLGTSSYNNRTGSSWKLAIWHMIFQVRVYLNKTVLQSLFDLSIWITTIAWVFFLFAIIFFNHDWQGSLHIAANFSSELTVTITNSENMKRWVTTYVWSQNILILIDLIWVVGMVSHTCCKSKFSYTIFSFFILRFRFSLIFAHILENRWVSSWRVLTFWNLFFWQIFIKVHIIILNSPWTVWCWLHHCWWSIFDQPSDWCLILLLNILFWTIGVTRYFLRWWEKLHVALWQLVLTWVIIHIYFPSVLAWLNA